MATPKGFLIRTDAQAKLTTRRMRQKVRQAIADREFVWWTRKQIQRIAPESLAARDWVRVAQAVREFVGSHIIFARDPVGIENLTPPEEHMQIFINNGGRPVLGDCDDAASLSAAMGMALGIPAEFVVRAFYKPDNPYQHILTYLRPKRGVNIDIDTTRDAQKLPPTATREFRMRI